MSTNFHRAAHTRPQTHRADDQRLIGVFDENRRGPLIIMIGGIHGNEKAGLKALEYLIKMLEVEHITNEAFQFTGRLIAIRGNIQAQKVNKRYINRDLNRMFRNDLLQTVLTKEERTAEEKELVEIIDFIKNSIADYHPDEIFVLDLHTTTAAGGIFTIINDSPEALEISLDLKAPVIEGFLRGIKGTILHYLNADNVHQNCTALCFEAGQHEDPLSVNRCIAAAVNFLSSVGAVEKLHIEPRHHRILHEYAAGHPIHSRLIYTHKIVEGDQFRMEPGFQNFDPIHENQLLANDINGPIYAPSTGLIVMPHYQEQGEDGFFIVEPLSDKVIG
ncbi:succinylglutamate desuccinylase/aspartoacylase family protein [Membranicola marinus]|uniref:Succinylglutamate desuccinylase/aspartoacylase family protein n=1 Tax=Membranihabitans marinus TaxID=1227546 RepID=A0A953HQR3_9BACT|nr:succinylglutamate desuccinylase/aspartoacylase family protein [Membranihabitans marinus]MBY5956665.1 succinylglutamate desuccinylase/aspartoacylase family protein [Membranihabitans marinus]